MSTMDFQCPKCGHSLHEIDEFRAPGGFWTRAFNIANKHFTTVTCLRCYYTEVYKTERSKLEQGTMHFRR